METIRMYLDNMFAGLPKTAQMSDIKDNILSNMEDKANRRFTWANSSFHTGSDCSSNLYLLRYELRAI